MSLLRSMQKEDRWPDFTPPLRRDYRAVTVADFCTAALKGCPSTRRQCGNNQIIAAISRLSAKHPMSDACRSILHDRFGPTRANTPCLEETKGAENLCQVTPHSQQPAGLDETMLRSKALPRRQETITTSAYGGWVLIAFHPPSNP